MNLTPRILATATALLLIVGCGIAPDDAVDIWPIIDAIPEIEIGELDGPDPYVFGRVAGIAFDDQYRVYVADAQADEVRVFGLTGEYLFLVASRGSGPGEVISPCCLAFDRDGRLWVRDTGNNRYNSYDILDTAAESVGSRRMAHGSGGYWIAPTFSDDGRLIDVGHRTDPDRGPQIVRFFLTSTSDVALTQVVHTPPADSLAQYEVEREIGDGRAVFFFQQPYGPTHLVAHSPLGGWAEAVSSLYAVRWRGPSEAFDHLIVQDVVGPPLSMRERERAIESLDSRLGRLNMTIADMPFTVPERKTPVRTLRFARTGTLWVFVSTTDGEPQLADVYDRSGKLVHRVRWPAGIDLRNGYFDATKALGVRTDSLGVQRVVRLGIS